MAVSNYRIQTDRFGIEDCFLFKNGKSRGCKVVCLFVYFSIFL